MEIELTFQLADPAALPALRRRFAKARRAHLHALYFDTADLRLARAGLALRLRQEQGVWMQTLKGVVAGSAMHRIEEDVPLPGRRRPRPDPARHAAGPAADALARALDGAELAAQPLFETDIERHTLRPRMPGGVAVEVALDEGVIRAGTVTLPVCEVEFELKDGGDEADLLHVARDWSQRYRLWLDVRNKAQRGMVLARGEPLAAKLAPLVVDEDKKLSPATALRRIVGHGLQRLLPQAAKLAEGDNDQECIHEMRVGLRRLRSALKLFGRWDEHAISPAWDARLGDYASALGEHRDRSILETELLPRILQAGGPPLAMLPPAPSAEALALRLRAPAFSSLVLDLLAFAHAQPVSEGRGVRRKARHRLDRFERKLRQEARGFDDADDAAHHRLRKRLKRLRYGLELVDGLLPVKETRHRLVALKHLQNALGRYNDMAVAQAVFTDLGRDPGVSFAAGWAAGQKEALLTAAEKAVAAWLDGED